MRASARVAVAVAAVALALAVAVAGAERGSGIHHMRSRISAKTADRVLHRMVLNTVTVGRQLPVLAAAHPGFILLAGCAYKKGICSICSKQIVDTKMYTMSTK